MAALDETSYDFKENDERQQSMDDIDNFERRMQNGNPSSHVVKSVATSNTRKPQVCLCTCCMRLVCAEHHQRIVQYLLSN